jgi:hypothetical protein
MESARSTVLTTGVEKNGAVYEYEDCSGAPIWVRLIDGPK